MIRLFDRLEIETYSLCNRRCPTCLRNSYPDKAATARCFAPHTLPTAMIHSLLEQAAALDFHGAVVLSLYNEPLLDDRIPALARFAQSLDCFSEVFMCCNGDLLTPALAADLDGALDNIRLALYDGHQRAAEMRAWFHETHVTFTGGRHIPRHFYPGAPTYPAQPCEMEAQLRCQIDSLGELHLCCEDIAGLWGLGNLHDRSLADLWYGEPHRSVLERLQQPGGRATCGGGGYCLTCPQPNVPYWSVGAQLLTSGDR